MPISITKLQQKTECRVVTASVPSLKDESRDMDGDVILRVLPLGQWRELQSKIDGAKLGDDPTLEEQMETPARLISACLTDDQKTVISYDEALALCCGEGGLDGIQIKELINAISEANGLTSGN